MILWKFGVDKPKVGRLWLRLVNANDTELKGRTHAKLVTTGGKSMVSDGQPSLLLLRASKSALRNGKTSNGLAIVAFKHITIVSQRFAIEG